MARLRPWAKRLIEWRLGFLLVIVWLALLPFATIASLHKMAAEHGLWRDIAREWRQLIREAFGQQQGGAPE